MSDDASCAINAAICAMREMFSPDLAFPPIGGGSANVRFFAGDAAPLAAWDAHVAGCGCTEPFLWVRLVRRYRTKLFPSPFVGPDPCPLPRVIVIEMGVGRCAVTDAEPTWKQYQEEAEISLDDSARIEGALCRAGRIALDKECADITATDAVVPFGPEGGIIAWSGTLYLQL